MDLGVVVDCLLKTSALQLSKQQIRVIKKGIVTKMESIIVPLYKSMVCPAPVPAPPKGDRRTRDGQQE